nr:hypothetical protein [Ramlibacter alkalitolerans]
MADWRGVRVWEGETRERLRRRHALWLHGWCIGALVLLVTWGVAHLQMVLGSGSLAGRYLVSLGAGYLVFLLVLRWWAGWLVDRRASLDAPGDWGGGGGASHDGAPDVAPIRSGGGGDFGGGGAQGNFSADADFSAIGDAGPAIGDLAAGAAEVAGSADEGAVVVIPVVVVFVAGVLVLSGVGSLLLLYFGSEVLLAVAVEIAFGYVSARTALRVAREGWLTAAVRLTWKPLLGALACAVLLGGLLDVFAPQARSLPQAVKLWSGAR